MIELILATDMSRHKEYMEKFKAVLSDGFDWSNEDHRRMVHGRVLLHRPAMICTSC